MKRLSIYLLGLCLLVQLLPVCSASNGNIEAKVTIYAFDFDAIAEASAEELDETLYPSGMKLPTKYFDLMDFIPYENNVYRDDVARFLIAHYPYQHGNFTYPEYCAAREFIYFTSLYQYFGARNPVVSALIRVSQETPCKFFGDITNVVLEDSTDFISLLLEYRNLLEGYASGYIAEEAVEFSISLEKFSETDVRFTAGLEYFDRELAEEADPISYTGNSYSAYIRQLPILWDSLHYRFESTGLSGYLLLDSTFLLTEQEVPVGTLKTGEQVIEEDPVITPMPSNNLRDVEGSIEIIGELSAQKSYNFRDVLSVLALIFSLATVVVLWVMHTVKQRRDPLRKWLS